MINPTFSLDFTTAILPASVTFARASNTATVINSNGYVAGVLADTPRFDYNSVTTVCKGLLIEGASENLFLRSQELENAAWTRISVGVSDNVAATTSPANDNTADKITLNNGVASAGGALYQQIAKAASSITYTFSIYAKADGSDVTTVRLFTRPSTATGSASAYFNLATGLITEAASTAGSFSNASASIVAMKDGWYRCSLTFTTGTETLLRGYLFMFGNANISITGDGSKGVYTWGAQLEAVAFATSYIPTTTAALTRNADVATITGTNFSDWWQASKGGVLVRARPGTVSGTRPWVQFDDGTANEIIALRGNTTNPELYIVDGGSPQVQIDAGTIAANTNYSLMGWWDTNNCVARINPNVAIYDTTATIPTVTQMRIGSDGTDYINGHIAYIDYYDSFFGNYSIYDSLRLRGYTGAIPDMLLQYYKANSATSNCLTDAENQFLIAKGYTTGAITDKWFKYLTSLGYTGTITDMLHEYWNYPE